MLIEKETHDDYMRLYKELIDRINKKEIMIEEMNEYIARYGKKTKDICKNCEANKCNVLKCRKQVRIYFEGVSK